MSTCCTRDSDFPLGTKVRSARLGILTILGDVVPEEWPDGRTCNKLNASKHKTALYLFCRYVQPLNTAVINSLGKQPSSDAPDAETREWDQKILDVENRLALEGDFLTIFTCRPGEPSVLDEEDSVAAGILLIEEAKSLAGLTKYMGPPQEIPPDIGPPPSVTLSHVNRGRRLCR